MSRSMYMIFKDHFLHNIGDTVYVKYNPVIDREDFEYKECRKAIIVNKQMISIASDNYVFLYGVNLIATDSYEEFSESELEKIPFDRTSRYDN